MHIRLQLYIVCVDFSPTNTAKTTNHCSELESSSDSSFCLQNRKGHSIRSAVASCQLGKPGRYMAYLCNALVELDQPEARLNSKS